MRQQPIRFPRRAFLAAVCVVVLLVAAGVVASWLALRAAAEGPTPAATTDICDLTPCAGRDRPEEIGGVPQTLIRHEPRALERRTRALERLSAYGWVDRESGLVHIPIERAMEIVAEEGW